MNRKRQQAIFFLLLILLLLLPCQAIGYEGGEVVIKQIENHLIQLVNSARQNPLGCAEAFGRKPEQLLVALPELQQVLMNGLPPFTESQLLNASAQNHLEDMLDRDFYSHISPEGVGPEERISQTGYDPIAAGESLGVLAFLNYMDPVTAADQIFRNIFLDELESDRAEPRHILNPNLRDIGLGFGSGSLQFGERTFNAYLVVLDFGTRILYDISIEAAQAALVNLINQARSRPLEVAEWLGEDPEKVAASHPDIRDLLKNGLPPLNSNPFLGSAAVAHTVEMVEHSFISHDSIDGQPYHERLFSYGYAQEATVNERLSSFPVMSGLALSQAVNSLFSQIFLGELQSGNIRERIILNPMYTEVGIGFRKGSFGLAAGDSSLWMMTLDVGTGALDKPPFISGFVFADVDQDGFYSAGEGLSDIPIRGYGYDTQNYPYGEFPFELFSNPGGGYAIAAFPGLFVWNIAGYAEQIIPVNSHNVFRPMDLMIEG